MVIDPLLLAVSLAAAAALVIGLVTGLALSRSRGRGAAQQAADSAAESAAMLDARLRQLGESQSATQAQMAETLRQQERALARMVEERLGDFGKRVGDRLNESQREQQTSLTQLRERLAVIDEAQKNITQLSTQVVSLQDVLANKQARGAFGEIQLKDIVTAILPPSAYSFQATLGNGKRADCLLALPNPPGSIAIDSKFPLESYAALRDAKDDAAAIAARRQFASDLQKHVKDISERYIIPGETAESALLFLPSEAVYAEIHANFRNIVEQSYRARVWIVSPTTLMATLNTVRAVLKDVRMREQAGVIQTEVRRLLEDVVRLDDRVDKLQRHFDQANTDIRQIRTSADKITKRSERIEELQLEDSNGEDTSLTPTPAQQRMAVDG